MLIKTFSEGVASEEQSKGVEGVPTSTFTHARKMNEIFTETNERFHGNGGMEAISWTLFLG